jgi:putative ABC transport system permease protein
MDLLRQDVRFALRSLKNARTTSIIAILCLALGIGANTAIFSVVRAVLLEALPYAAPHELVSVNEFGAHGPGSVSGAVYFDLKAERRIFSDVAAWGAISRDLGDVGEPERLRGVRGTTNLFSTLGVKPLIGRTFIDTDAPPTGAPVVVLSEGLWRRRFGGDPKVLGTQITLSNTRVTVIGVMPASFDFPVTTLRTEFWMPLDFSAVGGITERNSRSLQVIARLAPGLDSASAANSLSLVAKRLAEAYPEAHKGRGLLVRTIAGTTVGQLRPALLVLLAAVGLVLLIACAYVANLSLARAEGRRREIAIRTALGAERPRLIRQLLTESTILSLAGGALGLVVAWWGLHALLGMSANVLPRSETIGIHSGVLVFATIVSLATGMGIGIIPALRATRSDLRADLSDAAGKSSASAARHRTLKALIVGEIALSVVLLTGAGLVIRSFVALLEVDAGFSAEHVLTFNVAAPAIVVPDSMRYAQVYGPILERLRALPGVRAAGMTNVLPVAGGMTDRFFQITGRPAESDINRRPDAQIRAISRDYFRALGIRLLSGREFNDQDTDKSDKVIIVNEELVRRYFPNENPIGQRIEITQGIPFTIVGVVRAVREIGLDQALLPEFYVPATQTREGTNAMAFVVSTTGDAEALAREVRGVVRAVVPRQPVYGLATMNTVVRESLGSRRLLLTLLGLFAGLALVLSAAGVYGVMSYGVTQRRREIGIRIALGAKFGDVTSMVLRDVIGVAAIGIGVGIVTTLAFARVMTSVLYGVSAYDIATYLAVPVVIGAVALFAGAIPAMRAARIDPLIAMRTE